MRGRMSYRALEFGDLNKLRLAHGDDLVQEVSVLPSADVTGPNLLISRVKLPSRAVIAR